MHLFILTFQKGGEIKSYAPPLTEQDFNRQVGTFSQSIFCSNSYRALTATSVGNVVVWDNTRPVSGREYSRMTNM